MHDDRDIIKAIRKQPEHGFRLLLQYYQKPVYWYARRMVVAHAAPLPMNGSLRIRKCARS